MFVILFEDCLAIATKNSNHQARLSFFPDFSLPFLKIVYFFTDHFSKFPDNSLTLITLIPGSRNTDICVWTMRVVNILSEINCSLVVVL